MGWLCTRPPPKPRLPVLSPPGSRAPKALPETAAEAMPGLILLMSHTDDAEACDDSATISCRPEATPAGSYCTGSSQTLSMEKSGKSGYCSKSSPAGAPRHIPLLLKVQG